MPNKHAALSASSAHRWLNCPPSVRIEEQFPDSGSDYAKAGTLAHSIAELKARKYFLEPMSQRTYNSRLKKLKSDPHYDKGMDNATDEYLEHLKSLAMSFGDTRPFVALECRVDYSNYAPDGFGTADCIMIGAGRVCIVDYKNGSGVPVEAENNPQMMLYALGVLQVYAPIYGNSITDISLSIVQPNAGGVKAWNTTTDALIAWGNTAVRPIAQLAYAGEGEPCAGDWCRFCRAKAKCATRAAKMLELEPLMGAAPAAGNNAAKNKQLLSDAEIGDVLSRGEGIAAWIKNLQDYALHTILTGGEIPGYKAVAGRGSRSWIDTDQAFETLQSRGVAEALLWERRPITAPALAKALGEKQFAEVTDGLVIQTPGKPTLAPETDKRPPYNSAEQAFQPIENK